MNIENKIFRKVIWIVSGLIIITGTYYWISFKFNLNVVTFWFVGFPLSLTIVFVLQKTLKLWKIPIVIIAMDLMYHLYSAINQYFKEPIYRTFLQALQYTYSGDYATIFYYAEIPFIMLTMLCTLGFYNQNNS